MGPAHVSHNVRDDLDSMRARQVYVNEGRQATNFWRAKAKECHRLRRGANLLPPSRNSEVNDTRMVIMKAGLEQRHVSECECVYHPP